MWRLVNSQVPCTVYSVQYISWLNVIFISKFTSYPFYSGPGNLRVFSFPVHKNVINRIHKQLIAWNPSPPYESHVSAISFANELHI